MLTSELKASIRQLPQTDDKKDTHILNARKKHARSYIAWDCKEQAILEQLVGEKYEPSIISTLLKRSQRAVEARIKKSIGEEEDITAPSPAALRQQSDIKRVLHYWRNSLSDASKMGLTAKKMRNGAAVTAFELKDGRLSPEKTQLLFDDIKDENKEKDKIDVTSVIIAPYTFLKKHEHGSAMSHTQLDNTVFPLYISASMTREGRLIISNDAAQPWINRNCLSPNNTETSRITHPIIGDISHVDAYYTKNQNTFAALKEWNALYEYATKLFHSLIEDGGAEAIHENYEVFNEGYILAQAKIIDASRGLISAYDQYLSISANKIPKILHELCSLTPTTTHVPLTDVELFNRSKNHLGNIQKTFPLAQSQRISLSYLSTLNKGQIFTIQGPPGTGKTTLISSIAASEWVKAAIAESYPPITVVSSINNRAVTGILDKLRKSKNGRNCDLPTRWLPEFNDYGLYLPATSLETLAKEAGYPYRLKKGNYHSHDWMYEQNYQTKAAGYFLSQYNKHFNESESSIESCKDQLHALLVEKQLMMNKAIDTARDKHLFEKYFKGVAHYENVIQKDEEKLVVLSHRIWYLNALQQACQSKLDKKLGWLRYFKWTKKAKSLMTESAIEIISQHQDIFKNANCDPLLILQYMKEESLKHETKRNEISMRIAENKSQVNEYERHLEAEKNLIETLGFGLHTNSIFNFDDEDGLNATLDKTLRYELFFLATHYWEARWLLESDKVRELKYAYGQRKLFWQIQAMLAPCIGTTLLTGPSFFQHRTPARIFEFSTNMIDFLIIDEAGQVMPANAAPMIAAAQKAIIIGDNKQIEPIFNINESVDIANAKKFGLCKDLQSYKQLHASGILCSGNPYTAHSYGNLVTLSQSKSRYHLSENLQPGMLLLEHRRCPKEIIQFCNELCYENKLKVRTTKKPSPLPRMGYAHIKGRETVYGASRRNEIEAETIVEWLKRNESILLEACQKERLDDCLSIVTPYRAQVDLLVALFSRYGLDFGAVGTIHSLQGSEKPFVLFSPVCVSNTTNRKPFFDNSPNMLNVAVSRAELSFLVFGDLDLFRPGHGNSPTSVLAKYLFASQNNEITDIQDFKYTSVFDTKPEDITQLSSLDKHRRALKKSFLKAVHTLNIVSPYLSINAIKADGIEALIKNNCGSKSINIYTDPTLANQYPEHFNKAIQCLINAGANVYLVKFMHSKIVTIDNNVIIEGSFNWLSAQRSGNYQRLESSIIYTGDKASKIINDALKPILVNATAYHTETFAADG